MSVSRALNAVIAKLEDRPELFKELLRAPESNVTDVIGLDLRLQRALNRYVATQIRLGLMKTCRVVPSDQEDSESFFAGVRATEAIFEALVATLEQAS